MRRKRRNLWNCCAGRRYSRVIVTKYISLNLTPALRAKFTPDAEADTLAMLTPAGIDLIEAMRRLSSFENDQLYMYAQQGWWTTDATHKRIARVPFPGADMHLAGIYGELKAADEWLDGAHDDGCFARIVEQRSRVLPKTTQRIMVLHADKSFNLRHPKYGKPRSYGVQDKYAEQLPVWLRDYRGSKDSGYRHIRRQAIRAIEAAGKLDHKFNEGDEAYRRWFNSPETQARLWAAVPYSVTRAAIGKMHTGRPSRQKVPVDRVFSRLMVYRPGEY